MNTFATVIIAAADQAAAQVDLPGHFSAAYTTDPTGAPPATNYVSSGYWFDAELDKACNETTYPRTVKFGDTQAALEGLTPVVEPVTPEVV